MKAIIERCEYVAAKMSDGEIRRLADGCGIDSKFRTVMLAYIGMRRRKRRVADTAISFGGYAVRKGKRWLGYCKRNPHTGLFDQRGYSIRPKFPCVCAYEESAKQHHGHLGEIVRVKITMEEYV